MRRVHHLPSGRVPVGGIQGGPRGYTGENALPSPPRGHRLRPCPRGRAAYACFCNFEKGGFAVLLVEALPSCPREHRQVESKIM